MATHSSILAWKIPWTEEAGGLQYLICKLNFIVGMYRKKKKTAQYIQGLVLSMVPFIHWGPWIISLVNKERLLIYSQSCITIIMIIIFQNIFTTPTKIPYTLQQSPRFPSTQHPFPCPWEPLIYFLSVNLLILGVSYQ